MTPWSGGPFRFGVPPAGQREFFGDEEAERLYEATVRALESLGGSAIEFDFRPFRDAADLLYSGPWVAERLAVLQEFFESHAEEMHPIMGEDESLLSGLFLLRSPHYWGLGGLFSFYTRFEEKPDTNDKKGGGS